MTDTTNATMFEDDRVLATMADEQDAARIKPLPVGVTFLFTIDDYKLWASKPKDDENGKPIPPTPLLTFRCKVQDEDPEINGRFVSTGMFFLSGRGIAKLIGDGGRQTGFAEILRPNRKFKAGTVLFHRDGSSQYLDSFKGCEFSAEVEFQTDWKTGEVSEEFQELVNWDMP